MPQDLLFELDDVRITPYVAQFGGTSYQIRSISSVRATRGKRLSRLAVLGCLLGVGLFAFALARSDTQEHSDANFPFAVAAAAIVVLSVIVQLFAPRRIYKLVLRTHGGDAEVLTSYRNKFIMDVKQAVEEAFIAHAHRSDSGPDHRAPGNE
jgi:hypothetical protein